MYNVTTEKYQYLNKCYLHCFRPQSTLEDFENDSVETSVVASHADDLCAPRNFLVCSVGGSITCGFFWHLCCRLTNPSLGQ